MAGAHWGGSILRNFHTLLFNHWTKSLSHGCVCFRGLWNFQIAHSFFLSYLLLLLFLYLLSTYYVLRHGAHHHGAKEKGAEYMLLTVNSRLKIRRLEFYSWPCGCLAVWSWPRPSQTLGLDVLSWKWSTGWPWAFLCYITAILHRTQWVETNQLSTSVGSIPFLWG